MKNTVKMGSKVTLKEIEYRIEKMGAEGIENLKN